MEHFKLKSNIRKVDQVQVMTVKLP